MAGDIVYSKVNPGVTLVVRRFVDDIYYCRLYDNPSEKEQVYFERELFSKGSSITIDQIFNKR